MSVLLQLQSYRSSESEDPSDPSDLVPSKRMRVDTVDRSISDVSVSTNLVSLHLPDTVVELEAFAFRHGRLASVRLPAFLTSIPIGTFAGNAIRTILWPEALRHIGDYAFQSNQLHTLPLPNSVRTIGAHAFQSNRITSISLSKRLRAVGEKAFFDNRLQHVSFELSSRLEHVGSGAFQANPIASVSLSSAQMDAIHAKDEQTLDLTAAFDQAPRVVYKMLQTGHTCFIAAAIFLIINTPLYVKVSPEVQQFCHSYVDDVDNALGVRFDRDDGVCRMRAIPKAVARFYMRRMQHTERHIPYRAGRPLHFLGACVEASGVSFQIVSVTYYSMYLGLAWTGQPYADVCTFKIGSDVLGSHCELYSDQLYMWMRRVSAEVSARHPEYKCIGAILSVKRREGGEGGHAIGVTRVHSSVDEPEDYVVCQSWRHTGCSRVSQLHAEHHLKNKHSLIGVIRVVFLRQIPLLR